MAVEFTEDNFQAEVLESSVPVLVDFWSDGCPPCKQLAPLIEELATENEGKAVVGKVNVSYNMSLAGQYGITGVPTILVFKNGEVIDKKVGFAPKDQLQTMIAQAT